MGSKIWPRWTGVLSHGLRIGCGLAPPVVRTGPSSAEKSPVRSASVGKVLGLLDVLVWGDVSKADQQRLDFRKGAIVRIDVGALPSGRPSEPRWHMRPRSRLLVKGLPLKKLPKPTAEKRSKASR